MTAWIDGGISSLVCIRDELMIATKTSHIVRHKWEGTPNRDYSLDLRRIPFSVDQQISTVAVPITENNVYVTDIEYSPLVGGFAVVLSNGKAAFLTAQSLKFDPNVSLRHYTNDRLRWEKFFFSIVTIFTASSGNLGERS